MDLINQNLLTILILLPVIGAVLMLRQQIGWSDMDRAVEERSLETA